MQNKLGTLWLIGAGNMGGSLLARWRETDICDRYVAIDPGDPPIPDGVEHVASIDEVEGDPDIVVLAVKPHLLEPASKGLLARLKEDTLVVSVMAGLQLSRIRETVGGGKIVRSMPNTPTAIGKGVTGLFGTDLTERDRDRLTRFYEVTGVAAWLEEEAQFDALTAVSGSGPAYIFRMAEALAAAGESAGLPADLAYRLAEGTVSGAGALLAHDPRKADELRRAVTSPNGTTQAGLEALDEDPGLPALVRNAVRAAAARSRELASE
ncbi:pyrroline-5-carboxylate reductase [Pacificimonas flava]|uniref:Pyrroline-5-carboxylate reductase n=2 Tax=Pacificimonas TaxID=1960290 RepID=A0A219B6P9_9SPHN|nr:MULTISPECIES: pyrroline-5-carboxylate reductase [Pacificimonas]MBZ6378697.1 pyrroline-5-carboxylate reductase [Pacificimonas aurantium]OWV34035.1 pyrroline-5-carboxylate reductase [Pacificimonas flava]